MRPLLVLLALTTMVSSSTASAADKSRWRTGGGKVKIEVDGEVSRLLGKGWVRTTQEYLDQDVEFDFRLTGREAKGAVWIRAIVDFPNRMPSSGYRVALSSNTTGKHALGSVEGPSGSLEGRQGAATLSDGDWQHVRVRADHDVLTVVVNGETIATLTGRAHQAGYVGFEIADGMLDLRRIRVENVRDFSCEAEALDQDVHYPQGPGITSPQLRRQVRPRYSLESLNEKVTGVVVVRGVVMPDGSLDRACIAKTLHPDLDMEALAAARQWKFTPGTRDGKLALVRITIELSFTLK